MKRHKIYRVKCYINNLPFTAITSNIIAYNIDDAIERVCRRLSTRFRLKLNEIKISTVEECK